MGELAAAEQRASEAAARRRPLPSVARALAATHAAERARARFLVGLAGLRESLGGRPY